jgi:hypothetical protein
LTAKYTTSDTPPLPQLLQPIFSPDPSTLGFSSEESSVLSPSQIDLIYRIIPSVSWSKEKALRAESEQAKLSTAFNENTEFSQTTSDSNSGSSSISDANADHEIGWTRWHQTCLELHAVQDADRLDAIGAVGIFRVAAFSGAKGRCLVGKGKEAGDTAEQHFYDKLLKVKDRMKVSYLDADVELGRQIGAGFAARCTWARKWSPLKQMDQRCSCKSRLQGSSSGRLMWSQARKDCELTTSDRLGSPGS